MKYSLFLDLPIGHAGDEKSSSLQFAEYEIDSGFHKGYQERFNNVTFPFLPNRKFSFEGMVVDRYLDAKTGKVAITIEMADKEMIAEIATAFKNLQIIDQKTGKPAFKDFRDYPLEP